MFLWDPTLVGENEIPFIRVWKLLPSRRVLKVLRGITKRTISASSGLEPLQMVSKPDTGRCANEKAEPRRGVDTRRYANKDVGPRIHPHIDWRREWVSARTLGPEEGWIVRSHIGWGENKTPFTRVWKPLPSRRVLKALRGNPKGKAQRGQYLLAVGLSRYKWYKSWTPGNVPTKRLSLEWRWTQGGVPTRMLDPKGGWIWEVPHQLEGTSVSEYAGPRRGVDCEIPHS